LNLASVDQATNEKAFFERTQWKRGLTRRTVASEGWRKWGRRLKLPTNLFGNQEEKQSDKKKGV